MKKILWFLLPLLLVISAAVSASAEQYVYDNADILTESEEVYLNALAAEEGRKYGISIVVLTEDGIDGADPMYYAADFYDYGAFSADGVILFLEMEERDWCIVNSGMMMDVIGDYEIDYIGDRAVSYFSDGDYAAGFGQYIITASAMTDMYFNGTFTGDYTLNGYDPDGYYGEGEVGGLFYVVALGVSLLIAFLVCNGFKNQLNTAVKKLGAADYFRSENAALTHSADRFLYSRTTKTAKPSDNNNARGGGARSFSGSSGRSHSGGGGKF